MRHGKVIKPDEFEALPAQERDRIQSDMAALQEELRGIVGRLPTMEKTGRDRVRKLNREMAGGTVGVAITQA